MKLLSLLCATGWSLNFRSSSTIGYCLREILVALSTINCDSDLWFVFSSKLHPYCASTLNMSARKLPGSMEGSCRTSPSKMIRCNLASNTNALIMVSKVVTATREHSSTTTVWTFLNFHLTFSSSDLSFTYFR